MENKKKLSVPATILLSIAFALLAIIVVGGAMLLFK